MTHSDGRALPVGAPEIEAAARQLGLDGRSVCLHSSLRSFGAAVAPSSLVDGLLAAGCTILVPTFSWDEYALPPPPGMRPRNNGTNYEGPFRSGHERRFWPGSNAIDAAMGAVPRYVVGLADRVRGNHPLVSFTAVGDDAFSLVRNQTATDPFAPLRDLVSAEGCVLLIGVGYSSMTLLHLAEQEAGRPPFLRWAADDGGATIEAAVGGCSSGFDAFEPLLQARELVVGRSRWRALDAAQTLAKATTALVTEPALTQCGDRTCLRCRDVAKDRC